MTKNDKKDERKRKLEDRDKESVQTFGSGD